MTGPVLRAGAWPAVAGLSVAAAGTAVVLVLIASSLVPQVARWVRTFPPLARAGRHRTPFGGPSSRCACSLSPFRPVAEGPGGGLTVGRPTGVNSVRNIRAAEGQTGTRYQALTGIRGPHKMKERLR